MTRSLEGRRRKGRGGNRIELWRRRAVEEWTMTKFLGTGVAALALLAGIAPGRAAAGGREAVVIFNSRMPESKAIADHYAALRQVPTNQIFGFDLSTTEEIRRAEFRDDLQRPLAEGLEARKLWRVASSVIPAGSNEAARVEWKVAESKIRYAVLCYGVPLKILRDDSVQEEGADKLRPEMRRNEASVDSELMLLPLLRQKLPLSGPLRSPVYAATNTALLHPTNGVLMVARLDGPSPGIARELVDKALQAERGGLWGRAYFDLRNITDPGYKPGDDSIRAAAEIARHLGFETVVDDQPGTFSSSFPMSQIAFYAGWYDQDVSGPFARAKVEFMPGAFAYHLHSYSAATLRSTNKFWVGPLLAKGAAATLGCVDEPYLAGTPDMAVFTARWMFSGFTFGEAALASQPVLSWQTTVVGDPLYCPFGGNPDLLQDELLRQNSPNLEWSYLRLLNVNLANGRPLNDCVNFLEELDLTKKSAVLMEKLGDLYAAQGKPSSAAHSCLEALKLDPSPQQRLRLLLAAMGRLAALDRAAEAWSAYETLRKDYADFPDKAALEPQALALARKLGKTDEVARIEASIQRLSEPAAGHSSNSAAQR